MANSTPDQRPDSTPGDAARTPADDPGAASPRLAGPPPGGDWWRTAVIYQIYPKSFADADGDGVGDLPGIRSRLDYLADLGVDAIWLSPIFTSPQRDGGYDVADYRDVDPLFGSVDDLRALVAAAHERGLRVLLDIVPNHSSDQHRFFREALATDPGSPAWGRYHCVRGAGAGGQEPPNDWGSIFGGSAWSPIRDAAGEPTGWWYLHLFDPSQPDLNWDHPDVHAEFIDALRFWFDLGVDGFRIDVAMGLVKAPGYPPIGPRDDDRSVIEGSQDWLPQWHQPGVHDVWRAWRRVADAYDPPRVFVGEVHAAHVAQLAEYLRPDELHMAFNFAYLDAPWDAAAIRTVVDESLEQADIVGAPPSWVLENHDFNRACARFVAEPGAGLSRRVPAPTPQQAALGAARARASLLFMLALPGTVYLYQGQELGLPEADVPDELRQDPAFARTNGADGFRDGVRVPLPWTRTGSSFGFGPDGSRPWLPQPADWGAFSAAAQDGVPGSTLELVRAALRLRRDLPELLAGTFTWLDAPGNVLVARRSVAGSPGAGDAGLVVALNFGDEDAELPAGDVVISSAVLPGATVLPGNTAVWLRPPR